MVGDPNALWEDPSWRELLQYAVDNQSYRGCAHPLRICGTEDDSLDTIAQLINEAAQRRLLGAGASSRMFPGLLGGAASIWGGDGDGMDEDFGWKVAPHGSAPQRTAPHGNHAPSSWSLTVPHSLRGWSGAVLRAAARDATLWCGDKGTSKSLFVAPLRPPLKSHPLRPPPRARCFQNKFYTTVSVSNNRSYGECCGDTKKCTQWPARRPRPRLESGSSRSA